MSEGVPDRPSRGVITPCRLARARSSSTVARALLLLCALVCANTRATASEIVATMPGSHPTSVAGGGSYVKIIDNGDGTYDAVHIFTRVDGEQQFIVTDPSKMMGTARILVVGGGGAGGSDCGGGGGAGGYISLTGQSLVSGTYKIYVGSGTPTTAAKQGYVSPAGGNSSVTKPDGSSLALAYGGGSGGRWAAVLVANDVNSGGAGGSGGGGNGPFNNGGACVEGQGNAGAQGSGTSTDTGYSQYKDMGGGGGGAGGSGVAATSSKSGDGGPGIANDITGETIVYAKGGGGGGATSNIGYGGGDTTSSYGKGGGTNSGENGMPGEPNTGSGGGGGPSGGGSNCVGGAGADGIVVIRYTFTPADGISWLTPDEAFRRGGAGGGDYVVRIENEGVVSYAHVFNATYGSSIASLDFASTSRPLGSNGKILLVGGGGSGGGDNGGGGGAGGFVETNNCIFARGDKIDIKVGLGGKYPSPTSRNSNGDNGEDSTVSLNGVTLTALGGGGGAYYSGSGGGLNGGSGGGGAHGITERPGGSSIQFSTYGYGLGNAGGNDDNSDGSGGGGGGAGGVGGNAFRNRDAVGYSGSGGDGVSSYILGYATYYAAGGGGGVDNAAGGAKAQYYAGSGGKAGGFTLGGYGGDTTNFVGGVGMANTGSGGGGGGGNNTNSRGGAGGSGIVIIRYDVEEKIGGNPITQADPADVVALGGASGGDYINRIENADGTISFAHVFTNTSSVASFQFANPSAILENSAYFLAVGGGGGGGRTTSGGNHGGGGGGGAGGLLTGALAITSEEYSIYIGEGGNGSDNAGAQGSNGSDTAISNSTTEVALALGGGGGGSIGSPMAVRVGLDGGSGGGGVRGSAGGSGTTGQGYAGGGTGTSGTMNGGGGGGAGGAGYGDSYSLAGGDAVGSAITGYYKMYAGGGGGGSADAFLHGVGGGGVGGNGGSYVLNLVGTAGKVGTGSGGGGGGNGTTAAGAKGGSGIVVIRYTVRGAPAKEMDDGSTLYTFEDENKEIRLQLSHPSLVRILAVGGGGAGASGLAGTDQAGNGGGGAGGFIETNLVFKAGTYSVRIGAGGKPNEYIDVPYSGGNGKDTVISNVTESAEAEILRAYGGGGGAAHEQAAGNGGSGGGGNHTSTPGTAVDNGYGVQGNIGGEVAIYALRGNGAGGGGAGSVGGGVFGMNVNIGGDGGAGKVSDINGTEMFYAAGGGGGSMMGTGGVGGSDGVGGAGGGIGVRAKSGEPGTGGGGGGGGGTTPYGGSGGSGIAYIRVMREMPEKPETLYTTNYTGEVHTFYKMAEGDEYIYTITPDGSTTTTNEISGINAGTNLYTVALLPGACWYDGTTDDLIVTQIIERAEVKITLYEQPGWQLGGIVPDYTVETDPAQFADLVIREWQYDTTDPNAWTNWTDAIPATAGTWPSRAYIEDNENYYCATTQEISVLVWEYDPNKIYPDYLGYHSDITFAPQTGTDETCLYVTITNGVPAGFTYDQAEPDGSDIRFTFVTNDVLTLAHHALIGEWNPNGETHYRVMVPTNVTEVAMSWGKIVDDDGNEVVVPDVPARETYEALITITNTASANLTDYPMPFIIKEGQPAEFSYSEAKADGSDLRFSTEDKSSYLPYEIETWNTNGESLVWIKVPTYTDGAKFRMYWHNTDEIVTPASSEVWSAYAGVWHMGSGNDATAGTYGTDATYDSTGKNNSNTVLGSVSVSTNGVFGSGLGATVQGEPLLLVTASDSLNSITGAAFTVSFWTKFNATGTGTSVQYLFSRRPRYNEAGYAALINENRRVVAEASNKMRILFGEAWGSGGDFTASKFGFKTEEWIRHDVYFRGAATAGRFEWWINGVYIDGVSWNNSLVSNGTTGLFGIGGLAATGSDSNINGSMDEFRISSGAPTALQIAAETNMWARISSGEGVVDYGTTSPTSVSPAVITPGSIFQNKWVIEPVIDPEKWTLGESPTITAQPLYGTYSYTFTGDSGSYFNVLPATNGSYNATFTVPAAATNEVSSWGYSALEYDYKNAIVVDRENEGHHSIGGEWGPTMSGRVLLVNDEPSLSEPVKGQSYWQTNELAEVGTYWVHSDAEEFFGAPNLHATYTHTLYATTNITELCNTNIIWRLNNARIGNFYTAAYREQDGYRYLPFSVTAKELAESGEYESYIGVKAARNIVLRNTDEAEIISPCYTNGIGTIYFDAVNSREYTGAYTYDLQVEISTNEYIRYEITTNEYEEVSTNAVMEYNWQPLTIKPLRCVNKTFTKYGDTETLSLMIGASAAQNCFYRAVVPVYEQLGEYRGPARFRIKRVNSVDSEDAIDGPNQILIDNIVVSYPADGIRLGPVNEEHYDTSKTGFATLGVEYATEKPYPVVGDALKLRARAQFLLSPVDTNVAANVDASQYISSARAFYRWHYLNQHVDDWSTVALSYANLGVTNIMPATATTGAFTRHGDVEFFYETRLTAPYYTLYDYTGGGRQIPASLYTENISVVTNRYSARKDWFVRLREGESNLSEMHIIATDGTTVTTNNMELIGNDSWQGFYQTLTNTADKISFVVEMVNRQTEGAEWSSNTNWYKFSSATYYGATPATDTLSEMSEAELADVSNWSSVTNSGATGYLMFRVTDLEKGKSISIVRADMQNFNFWSDARQTYYVGYGEPQSTNSAHSSGTAAGKKLYSLLEDKSAGPLSSHQNFDKWTAMENTHTNWIQWVDAPTTSQRTRNEWLESDTWEAWNYGEMMWIGARYLQTGSGTLVQLAGDGKGWMQYNNVARIPRGIEKVEYSARVMQPITYDSFAYWNKGYFKTNYTFIVSARMLEGSTDDFAGDGSVSVVANYTPLSGGYEFRVVRCEEKKVYLRLYKWEGKTAKLLGTSPTHGIIDNAATSSATSGSECGLMDKDNTKACRLKISVSNGVDRVVVRGSIQRYSRTDYANSDTDTAKWVTVEYTDTEDPFTSGTFGMGSANCHAVFYAPRYYDDMMITDPTSSATTSGNWKSYGSSYDVAGLTTGRTNCFDPDSTTTTRWKEWSYDKTRWTTNVVASSATPSKRYFGFKALINPQDLIFETQDSGSKEWVVRATNTVDSLNSSEIQSVNIYATADTILRIKTGGKKNAGTPDIAIGNVKMYQWRGGSWNDTGDTSPRNHIANYVAEGVYDYTNITFMSAWITTNSENNAAILLSAKRTNPGTISGIKTPLMYDRATNGGSGIGMLSYRYSSAQTNTVLLVQVATNDIGNTTWTRLGNGNDTNIWHTVETHTFSEADLEGGIRSVYFGIHGLVSAARIIVSPEQANALSNVTDKTAFGDIYITDFRCTDEPSIDKSSWWGWNIRSVGNDAEAAVDDPEGRMYLSDVDDFPGGMSMSLNNSITADINPNETSDVYKEHMPFVQTPELGGSLGEIRFRARNYVWKGDDSVCDTNETTAADFNSTNATISLYGATSSNSDQWNHITTWHITNDIFTVYSYKATANNYKAFRLVANDVKIGGTDPSLDDYGYTGKNYKPVRFLIDEVVVAEGIKPIVLFRNVGAFRGTNTAEHVMTNYKIVPNVPSKGEQPLCDEPWGIQCEIYAAQLADEIDINLEDPPKVYLHYYPTTYPYSGNWGYSNWREKNEANTLELKLTEDSTLTNLFYRSSFVEGEAHMPIIANSAAPTTVQYILEVIYKQGSGEHAGTEITNVLDASQWTMPEWYAGADYNAQLGGNREENFAAYTILDTVAPGWAWFNEVNIFGLFDSNFDNSELYKQFIEIAIPAEADISGWRVNLLTGNNKVTITNRLVYFNSSDTLGISGKKTYTANNASNMSFMVIAPPNSALSTTDGSLDGKWSAPSSGSGAFTSNGNLAERQAFGLQLVRKSGVIEHEIVTIGTNAWGTILDQYDPERYTEILNTISRSESVNGFVYIGDDDSGVTGNSLSVFDEMGAAASVWTNLWGWTPGRINVDADGNTQKIDANHPTPNGETVIVTCEIDSSELGAVLYHMVDGSFDWTNINQIVYLDKGSSNGLKVVYRADPWFALSGVATDGVAIASADITETGTRLYEATVGRYASNRFTVVATPKLTDEIKIDDSRYHDAILDWLISGKTLKGATFKNRGSDKVYEVEFYRPAPVEFVTNLNLKMMYWLDIDPTDGPRTNDANKEVSNIIMYGGMDSVSTTNRKMIVYANPVVTNNITDVLIAPKIWFTNTVDETAWAPYVIRGAGVGETSWNNKTSAWSGASFKISGRMYNRTDKNNPYAWVPLRYFTFNDNSFDTNFVTRIEVRDVYTPYSIGYEYWKDAFDLYGQQGIGLFWMLDERNMGYEVEDLKTENYYGD